MERKILVAVDGSIHSSNTIHYLSRLFHGQRDIFLHLFSVIPAGMLPTGHELLDEKELLTTMGPAVQKKFAKLRRFIDRASEQLIRADIQPAQISSDIRLSRSGAAADILYKARQGLYDALVIGRRGLTKLEELILGSVSHAVLEKCHSLPIWIIDGRVDSDKILVPIDGTPHTLMAVDHLAFILQGNAAMDITLFHSKAIFAGKTAVEPHHFHAKWGPEWSAKNIKPDDIFHAPERLLLESGIPAQNIHRLNTNIGIYPSRQILRQALIDEFGTIVMGRRADEVQKGLFGSTSGKVAAMIENEAIWIVG
jgi:nucleotide-binding universal stress UspA family protein